MSDRIRVGIIGANPDRGWATRAHIPALRALPDYELTAVGTSRRESAERAARRFGADHPFTDARELAEHPDVDLVVITVKVPAHAELIRTALSAGKHVYSEWPLTRTTAEAEAIVAAAADVPGLHVVGLQAGLAPAVQRARTLMVNSRYVGKVVSVTVFAARGKGAGGRIPQWAAYTLDRDNGAGMLEVAGGHTLATVESLVGPLTEVSAELAIRHPLAIIDETGERISVTSPDHLLLTGRTDTGIPVSAHIHDGKVTDGRTRIEISGTDGDLVIVSDGPSGAGGIQMSDLRLLGSNGPGGAWQDLTPEEAGPFAALPIESRNVARLYDSLASDLRRNLHLVPSFGTGLHMHRVLDAIRRSADSGRREAVEA
ncbi:Gfo/Idh/MocA family protein [Nocardia sp. NPDC059246]|uniref:Gfo/Idh/MocA family protein n=1 Tax=unclassified Nocardia TaxID=2637762 RepID=UPI0036A73D9E